MDEKVMKIAINGKQHIMIIALDWTKLSTFMDFPTVITKTVKYYT